MAKKKKPVGNLSSPIYQEERIIGRQSAVAATNYVKSKIRSSSLTLRGIGSPNKKGKKNENERKPLLEATSIVPVMGTYRLLGFNFKSNRAGYVHHFGVTRDATKFLQTHSKTGTVFKKSRGGLDSQAFFDDIYTKSGALEIITNGLSKTRIKAVTIELENIVVKLNNNNG